MNSRAFLQSSVWLRPTSMQHTTTIPIFGKPPFLTFATTAMVNLTTCMQCETSSVRISSACLWTLARIVESGTCQQAQPLETPSLSRSGTVLRDTIPSVTRLATTWVATTTSRTPDLQPDSTMDIRIQRRDFEPSWPMTVVQAALGFNTFRRRTLISTAAPLERQTPIMQK